MDESIDILREIRGFSTVDASSAYWQMKISESDRHKTVFTSQHGLYRFNWMKVGLNNYPATIQMVMDVILAVVQL